MSQLLTVGFTATRDVADESLIISRLKPVTSLLSLEGDKLQFVTGACEGGDAIIGSWLLENYPEASHMVIVPADRSRVCWWWPPAVTEIFMPESTTYKDRNKVIVSWAETSGNGRFYGFPAYREKHPRSIRSGSWQTLRMARRAQLPGYWWSLNDEQEGGLP